VLRRLEPELAHDLTLRAMGLGLSPRPGAPDDPILATRLWGRDFTNPIGSAAGFDKDAVVIQRTLDLGFGFVEVGSITPRPQPGNPKPRIFRLPEDRAVINRFGFNSAGREVAARHLADWRGAGRPGLVGVNLGKNRDSADPSEDYVLGARMLAPYGDYLVINVSSPNTPGLRALQGRAELEHLLDRVGAEFEQSGGPSRPPLLLKVAPDLTEADREDIAAVALDRKLDGLIATNTTIARPADLKGRHRGETGGLSGRPLFETATQVLADLYRLTGGAIPLIGVGGVASGADAYCKIRAGASLVQLYTALVYHGPALVGRIKRDLAALLRRDGFTQVAQAVGADHHQAPDSKDAV
jgi:dihydroorotate dehydrogenase